MPDYFWAKIVGNSDHSLVAHLLDSAAVAELIWQHYLAPKGRRQLDEASGGRGRDLLVLLAVWHDLGKATPAFQSKAVAAGRPDLLERVMQAGLSRPSTSTAQFKKWPHGAAGAVIARAALEDAGAEGWLWVPALIAGHHGRYESDLWESRGRFSRAHGDSTWESAQQRLAQVVASRVGIRLDGWALVRPSRGVQLALGGLLVMADWIASSDAFPLLGGGDLTWDSAQERADRAWSGLALGRGWRTSSLIVEGGEFADRFGFPPRPLQQVVAGLAVSDPTPGLMIVEAPMGEGKTEAALAGAELLGRRAGASGLTFAMPTQGTTDAMYERVQDWLARVDPDLAVSLLHGKAMLNESWRALVENTRVAGVSDDTDEFGMSDDYGAKADQPVGRAAPSSWLAGHHRGLLSPVAVATVDQVLWAATRTKFVALRHAGLLSRVLVIDEVHSYDVYMSVFLHELLRWCARMQTPVILMSATLPPHLRAELVNAWRAGAGLDPIQFPSTVGYPTVLVVDGQGQSRSHVCESARPDRSVAVTTLATTDVDDVSGIATAVEDTISADPDQGVALVILNTVARAQQVYRRLREHEVPAVLIHGRLTARERADRTAEAIRLLGPAAQTRPRLVVVATQIAEQSFDVDADVLFTDIAPIDLLLQRVGRLHRHDRPLTSRPAHLRDPRVIVTGLGWRDGEPYWPKAFAESPTSPKQRGPGTTPATVYRPLPLLSAAAELMKPTTWRVPSDVPALVARAYDDLWHGPSDWAELVSQARVGEEREREERADIAATYRLDAVLGPEPDLLWELHALAGEASEGGRKAVVRDGLDSLEVALIRSTTSGFQTLGGRPLGRNAERVNTTSIAREVLGDTVRLRWQPDMAALAPLPQWVGHPLLGFTPVIVLDAESTLQLGARAYRYDEQLGLVLS